MKRAGGGSCNHISEADVREGAALSAVCNAPAAGTHGLPEVQSGEETGRTVSEHNISNTEQNITLCGKPIFGKM